MAEGVDVDLENCDEKLTEIFDKALDIYDDLLEKRYRQNDADLEGEVKKCMEQFELATRLVSAASLFSSNETVDEISTESLKYLLLPAFLGQLALRLISGSRQDIIEIAQIYLRDFVQRCKDYNITEVNIPLHEDEGGANHTAEALIYVGVTTREEKIKKYNEKQALAKKVNSLKAVSKSENIDESSKREYYLSLLQLQIVQSIEELEFIKAEMPLVKMMEAAKIEKAEGSPKPKKEKPPPLRPFIITKNDVQKAIYGLGYPAVPVYTVEEFYEQRVQDGSFPGPQSKSSTSSASAHAHSKEEAEELENENKEKLLDDDDPVAIKRAREMDEFKDDHKRGEGNRYNRS